MIPPPAVLIRYFSYFYPPCIGGGEVILQHQAEELARRGHEVHVHTTAYTNLDCRAVGTTGSTVENGVHVHRRASVRLPFRNPLEQSVVTPAFVREALLPADLFVCVGFPAVHLDLLSMRRPLVVQNYITADFLGEILAGHGGWNKRVRALYWKRWIRRQLAAADLVLADSPPAARALTAQLGLPNVRTHIGMAVDPAEFDAAAPAEAIRRKLGLDDARIVLAPSRISRQKGADLLVEAADVLPSGWRLVICGPVNDEGYAAEVRARAPVEVVMTQLPRPEFVSLMKAADVVVLPSRGETTGGVILEAMYCGACVIVSDAVEAAREDYLRHEANGLLFKSEDVPSLRTALKHAIHSDTSAMCQAGQQMIRDRFTWERSVDRLVGLYEAAIA